MNYWIFQSVPERYDLRDKSNLHDGKDGWWYATRYRKKMAIGDRVFFWMGGEKDIRGIYGVGKITSEPFEDGSNHKVNIKVDKRFPHHLMILKIAIGSNFLISTKEGQAILKLIGGGHEHV
ncbi:MAG: EVE domain-containing protein [Desulfuromonadaceae bacterium]